MGFIFDTPEGCVGIVDIDDLDLLLGLDCLLDVPEDPELWCCLDSELENGESLSYSRRISEDLEETVAGRLISLSSGRLNACLLIPTGTMFDPFIDAGFGLLFIILALVALGVDVLMAGLKTIGVIFLGVSVSFFFAFLLMIIFLIGVGGSIISSLVGARASSS